MSKNNQIKAIQIVALLSVLVGIKLYQDQNNTNILVRSKY